MTKDEYIQQLEDRNRILELAICCALRKLKSSQKTQKIYGICALRRSCIAGLENALKSIGDQNE